MQHKVPLFSLALMYVRLIHLFLVFVFKLSNLHIGFTFYQWLIEISSLSQFSWYNTLCHEVTVRIEWRVVLSSLKMLNKILHLLFWYMFSFGIQNPGSHAFLFQIPLFHSLFFQQSTSFPNTSYYFPPWWLFVPMLFCLLGMPSLDISSIKIVVGHKDLSFLTI